MHWPSHCPARWCHHCQGRPGVYSGTWSVLRSIWPRRAHSLCELPRLPVGLLRPHIYLLQLKAAASARNLPGYSPATDTHPLPVRAQLILWASAGHPSWGSTRQWVHHKMCTQSQVRGWKLGFNGEKMRVDSPGGWLWPLASEMLLTTSQPRPQISWTLSSFPGEDARSLP